MSEWPEHEKLEALAGESQIVGAFLDWLRTEQGYSLLREETVVQHRERVVTNGYMRSDRSYRDHLEEYTVEETAWVPCHASVEELLARYYHLDLTVLEQEKRAMLAEIRSASVPARG